MSEAEIRMRPASLADFAAMKKILADTFETTWQPAITAASARHYLEQDTGGRFVETHGADMMLAEMEGDIAGLIYRRGDFIDAVHVARRFQGKGVGRALLLHAEVAARAEGLAQLRLETDTFNERSHAVYRALGYVERDRYPDDEWNSGFTTILFVKQLA